jgi:hypothetical protein
MINRAIPIETEYGILDGRDSIFLDEISMSNRTNNLHLEGELNGSLCSKSPGEIFIPYRLTFEWVLTFKVTELDTWEAQKNGYNKSSFDKIEDSEWIKNLAGKKTPNHQHFIILTYDDVIEVVCKSYKFELGEVDA